jgi:O-antigen ligase
MTFPSIIRLDKKKGMLSLRVYFKKKKKLNLPILVLVIGAIIGVLVNEINSNYFVYLLLLCVTVPALLQLKKYLNLNRYKMLPNVTYEKINKYRLSRIVYYLGTISMAQLVFRPISGVTISDALYLLSMGMLVLSMLYRKKISYHKLEILLLIGLLFILIGGVISTFDAQSPTYSLSRLFRLLLIVVWFIASALTLKTEKQIQYAIMCWLISVAANGLVSVLQLKMNIPFTVNTYGRMTGFTEIVSDLGGSCAIAWITALVFTNSAKKVKAFLFYGILLTLIGLGVIMSGSVSGMITIVASTLIWSLIGGKPNWKFIIFLGVLITTIFTIISIQTSMGYVTPMSRFDSTTSHGDDGTAKNRFETFVAAFNVIRENPFVGVGFDDVKTTTGFVVHNLFLGIWFQGGIVSFIGIILMCLSILLTGIYSIKHSISKLHYSLSMAVFLSFISTLIFGMTAPFLYQRYAWIPAAFIIPLFSVIKRYHISKESESQLEPRTS